MLRFLAVLAALAPIPAAATTLNFCWQGAEGYTMTGRMQIPDGLMQRHVLTEADVTHFKIAGYKDGRLLGTWDNSRVKDGATWHMRFDPATMTFLTGGSFAGPHSQGWNADGNVDNCGSPGFGFNSGNYAQDICVNGTYVHTSSISPETPLQATFDPVQPDCSILIPTS